MTTSHWRLLLPLAYTAGLFLLSSVPGDADTGTPVGMIFQWITPQWQNLLHIPLYGGLAASWLWGLTPFSLSPNARLLTALALTLAWAVVDESYQSTVPGRYGSLTDLALNAVGAILIVLIAKRRNL